MFNWFLRLNSNLRISVVFLTIMVLWFSLGMAFKGAKKPGVKVGKGKGEIVVQAIDSTAIETYLTVGGYGSIDRDKVEITSELNSRVLRIIGKEGMKVKNGTPVVEMLNEVIVPSPVSGTLDKIEVIRGDVVFSGKTVLFSVVSDSKLDATLGLSASDARNIKIGNTATIEAGGAVFNGTVYFVSGALNRETNTFDVKIKVNQSKNSANLFHGESVRVFINTAKYMGHFVPSSALSIDKQGGLVVRYIEEGDIVKEANIRVLRTAENGMWVGGLPNHAIIITLGGDYVKAGDEVEYEITQQ